MILHQSVAWGNGASRRTVVVCSPSSLQPERSFSCSVWDAGEFGHAEFVVESLGIRPAGYAYRNRDAIVSYGPGQLF